MVALAGTGSVQGLNQRGFWLPRGFLSCWLGWLLQEVLLDLGLCKQASASNTSLPSIVEALPGGKINLGYAYQVWLKILANHPGLLTRLGMQVAFWDLATPQRGSFVGPLNFMGL